MEIWLKKAVRLLWHRELFLSTIIIKRKFGSKTTFLCLFAFIEFSRKRWQNSSQKPSSCLTLKTIWTTPKFCPPCWTVLSSVLDGSSQTPIAQALCTISHLPLTITDCHISSWDDQKLTVQLCHLSMKNRWLLVWFSVARESWFQNHLLSSEWQLHTKSEPLTQQLLLAIYAAIHVNSALEKKDLWPGKKEKKEKLDLWLLIMKEETEVPWAAVALFRIEEWVCPTFRTKHLSFEAMPCCVSFLCSYDFVR